MRQQLEGIDLSSLDDAELGAIILSDWRQLVAVLRHQQPAALLRRLIVIELASARPRANIVERIRGALARALSRDGLRATTTVLHAIHSGRAPAFDDLLDIGLTCEQAERVMGRR